MVMEEYVIYKKFSYTIYLFALQDLDCRTSWRMADTLSVELITIPKMYLEKELYRQLDSTSSSCRRTDLLEVFTSEWHVIMEIKTISKPVWCVGVWKQDVWNLLFWSQNGRNCERPLELCAHPLRSRATFVHGGFTASRSGLWPS